MDALLPQLQWDAMDYAKPLYSVQKVNEAGKLLANYLGDSTITLEQVRDALSVIENWRAAHNHPLNAFYVTLKNRAFHVSTKMLTAQRIKRLYSIAIKLWGSKDMKLSQMQDVGGCRAVMPTLADVNTLRDIYNERPIKHLRGKDKDYIAEPKSTGYRGIHIKYKYTGTGNSEPWNGLKIEIQLRTLLQHKWAASVEAAGTFLDQALKSNSGSEEWLRFFALMSSIFALREECETVPETPDSYEKLCKEIQELNAQHHIQAVFAQYHKIIPSIKRKRDAAYFLITLDPIKRETKIHGYKSDESQQANAEYTLLETTLKKPIQVVLVQVASVAALKRAYPNYFLDTQDFLRELAVITGVPV